MRLWRVADGALQATLEHSDDVMALAFSPDGRLLAAASADGSNALWRLGEGASRLRLRVRRLSAPDPGGDLAGELVGGLVERRARPPPAWLRRPARAPRSGW